MARSAVGVDFMPLAADTFGGFGVLAEEAMCKAAREAQLLRGGNALSCTQLRQRMQVAVMRGVARQLLRRITHFATEVEGEPTFCGNDC